MTHVLTQHLIKPWEHQSECLNALAIAEKTQNAGLTIMAGGLGKTIMSAFFVKRRFDEYKESRCLYLCHKNEALEQACGEYKKVLPNLTYGMFHGEEKSNLSANILFASFQTIRDNLSLFTEMEFDIIVVDETHHVWAPTYEKVIRYFTPHFLLGITATADRMDQLDIRDIYGKEVYHLSIVNALTRQLLCPIDYRLMTDEIIVQPKIATEYGRLSMKMLNKSIFVPKRDEEIATIINAEISKLENPRVMIFANSIEHAEILSELIPGAVPIYSGISKSERKVRLELFRQGVFQTLISVDMFTESLDVPEINLVAFLRMTGSPTVFFQQLFRGTRLHDSKEKLIVLDFVANCERIFSVYELWTNVKVEQELALSVSNQKGSTTAEKKAKLNPFALNVETIEFKQKIVPLIDTITQIRAGFYSTCKEASESVRQLGIKNRSEYAQRYKEDPRLVSFPKYYYEDFPGWPIFTGIEENRRMFDNIYPTYQEASEACSRLNINSRRQYDELYFKDLRLPSRPHKVYEDFPGWGVFLSTGRQMRTEIQVYGDVQDAIIAAQKLGATDCKSYKKLYKVDPKLPSSPDRFYGKDFPGWGVFLGTGNEAPKRKDKGELYQTWAEVVTVINALGIKSGAEYAARYQEDPRLPKNLWITYEDFPGWNKFFAIEGQLPMPEGWLSLNMASRECKKKPNTLKKILEPYRSTNPDWLKFYMVLQHYVECIHPDLVVILKEKFQSN